MYLLGRLCQPVLLNGLDCIKSVFDETQRTLNLGVNDDQDTRGHTKDETYSSSSSRSYCTAWDIAFFYETRIKPYMNGDPLEVTSESLKKEWVAELGVFRVRGTRYENSVFPDDPRHFFRAPSIVHRFDRILVPLIA